MKRTSLLLTIFSFLIFNSGIAQDEESIDQVIYLIGNTATSKIKSEHLSDLQELFLREKNPFTLIHLGDILNPSDTAGSITGIDPVMDFVQGRVNAKAIFTAGDMDWNNSGEDGLLMVRKLEEQIENLYGEQNIFLPSEGCPGPEIIDLTDNLRIIAINTQWWMHPFDHSEAPDANCSNLTKEEFIESLEEAIDESVGRNILIIGHHPVISAGIYGGHMTFQQHLFPFADSRPGNKVPVPGLGSFYAAYRQNVGTVRDKANEDYQEFIDKMTDILSHHPGLVYASAHDYSLQLLEIENGFQLISGSIIEKGPTRKEQGLRYSSSDYGFAKIEYYNSGEIRLGFYSVGNMEPIKLYSKVLFRSGCDKSGDQTLPVNRYYIPCIEEEKETVTGEIPFPSEPVTVIAGNYEAKGLKRVFLGSLYRETWLTPVTIPYLDLDTTKSGLKPFALGGGRQTTTLKFQANDGREYAFRSVDKNLVNALPKAFRNTFISTMIKEVTATEYPYGAIIVSSLLDETDILHASPVLYVLPDHPGLGIFREPYAGLFGMLEDRPKDPTGQVKGFMGADDVTRSAGLFRKLYKDNDNHVDALTLGNARAIDILVGDWGRH